MKETIYLVVSPYKVERMTKNLPGLSRGEIPVKLSITVDEKVMRPGSQSTKCAIR
jgi:hypothetical protein